MPQLDLAITTKGARIGRKEWEREIVYIERDAERGSKAADKLGLALRSLFAGFTARKVVQEIAAFETALVGVGKTADLSGAELRALGREVELLAAQGDIAARTNDLLAIAQAAGQLGVTGSENILKFAATVAKLGSASDLAGEQAATTLARLLTVTGESVGTVDRLASVIVRLGNEFAATESEIAGVATRVAQQTAVFGVSSAEAAAFGAALKSVGVEAELGGSALGRAFRAIESAVVNGGRELQTFAAIAQTTGDEFRDSFSANKVATFQRFVEGLGDLPPEFASVASALEQVGLAGDRDAGVFATLSGRADELARALATAADEAENVSALNAEAARGADTLAGDFIRLGNSVTAAFVALGDTGLAGGLRSTVRLTTDAIRILSGFESAVLGNREEAERLAAALRGVGAGVATLLGLRAATAAIYGTVAAVKALTVAMAANPLGLIAVAASSAVAALAFFKDELVTLRGVTASVTDFVVGAWDELVARVTDILGVLGVSQAVFLRDLIPVWDRGTASIQRIWGDLLAIMRTDTGTVLRELGAIFVDLARLAVATARAAFLAVERLLLPIEAAVAAVRAGITRNLGDALRAADLIKRASEQGISVIDPRQVLRDITEGMEILSGLGDTVEREVTVIRQTAAAGMAALAAVFGQGAARAGRALQDGLAAIQPASLEGLFDFRGALDGAAERAAARAGDRFLRTWGDKIMLGVRTATLAAFGLVPQAAADALQGLTLPDVPPVVVEVQLEASDAERALESYLDDLRFERSLLGLTEAARDRAIIQRQAEAIAAGEQSEAIQGLLRSISEEAARLTEGVELQRFFDELGAGVAEPIGRAITELRGLEETVQDIILNISRAIVQRNVVEPLTRQFSAAFAAVPGLGGGGGEGQQASDAAQAAALLTGGGQAAGQAIILAAQQAAATLSSLLGGAGISAAAGAAGATVASARGNVFEGGRVIPFAAGGIIDRPTTFPLAGGNTGLAGEAGPEAIVPLKRGADGRLGIEAPQSGPQTIVNNYQIRTADADSFRRSKRQIMHDARRGMRRF